MKEKIIKRIFWVILGVVFLGLVVFYFAGVRRQDNRNAEVRRGIDEKVEKMQQFAKKKDIKNDPWIHAAETRKMEVDQATQECKEFFEQNLNEINTRFREDPEDPRSAPIKDRATWKTRYYEERVALEARLKAAGMQVAQGAFDFRDWGDQVPTTAQIDGDTVEGVPQPGAQKEFWLQSYLVECMIRTNPEAKKAGEEKPGTEGKSRALVSKSHVVRFGKFAIKRPGTAEAGAPAIEGAPEAELAKLAAFQLVDSANPTYLIIPFTLTLDMDWRFVPFLLRNMETSPWPFYITTVDASRVMPPGEADKESTISGVNVFNLARVTIHAVALDFKPMTVKIAPPPEPAKPGKK